MDRSNESMVQRAKISRPRGNRPLLRTRLFQRLDDLRATRVTWVTGSPGCGKTTLISSYLAERAISSLWIQLDADDADVATFFYYLGLAVEQAAVHDGPSLPPLTPEYLPSLASFTRRCAQALAARIERPAIIVLDNTEQVPAGAALHEVVRELAVALPQDVTLVVLSRAEPPAAYARLRLHEELVVLDGEALNLTPEEALSMVAARPSRHAPTVDGALVERLLADTQGWLAGFALLLAEGSVAEHRGAATNRRQLLFDYFATELFGRIEAPMQLALSCIALLPTMTVADAERLSGNAAVGGMLGTLHRQNCFVVRRGQVEAVYEYQALFRTFLLEHAAATRSAEDWRDLQCRAADLLVETRQVDAAAALYGAVRHWPALSALILREAPALVSAGRHRTLDHWLSGLPGDVFDRTPWLHHWQATARLPFDAAAARDSFERAYAGFQAAHDAVGLYSTWAGAMESYFFEWRDFTLADRWIAEFDRLRADHPEFPSRAVEMRTYWAMGTMLHRQPSHPTLPLWAERVPLLLDAANRAPSVMLGGYLVIWFMWRGEIPKAREMIARIAPWADPDLPPMVRILWQCAVALYHSVLAETEDCRRAVESGLALSHQCGLHAFDFLLAAQMARCCLIAGDPDAGDPWMADMARTMRSHSHVDGAFFQYLQCNAAAQRGTWQRALDHGRGAMAMALESGTPFIVAQCHLSLARALLGRGSDTGWAQHVDAARAIGLAMKSPAIEYLCLECEATVALRNGDAEAASERLSRALALSHLLDGNTWQMGGPQASAALYDSALAAGIETAHVQRQIRRHRITPPDPAAAAETWPWPIRVYTLGRFDVVCDGQPLRSPGKAQHKPLELLKCLCAFGGQAVNQDRVTDALWPDTDGDAADQVLRTTLHRLRKLLRHDAAVRLEDRHLRLDPHIVWADCLAFDRAARQAPAALDKAHLQRALNRYRGAFLDGESAPWALACRDRLHARFLSLAERLGVLLEAERDWPGTLQCCLQVIELEPTAEGAYRRLMRAHAQQGQRAEALDAYRRCRQTLLSRQGVGPSAETQAVYRQLAES